VWLRFSLRGGGGVVREKEAGGQGEGGVGGEGVFVLKG